MATKKHQVKYRYQSETDDKVNIKCWNTVLMFKRFGESLKSLVAQWLEHGEMMKVTFTLWRQPYHHQYPNSSTIILQPPMYHHSLYLLLGSERAEDQYLPSSQPYFLYKGSRY